ncbi:hypothetical protein [Pontibacillus yanchengensis]|uniref:hypothetical protein n=1 Tax=Pontibacillus yanchengensis TaxID=462910 RepID=UPI000B0336B3|nr:hypothetical protein [Pontibacillus yanchengensis]
MKKLLGTFIIYCALIIISNQNDITLLEDESVYPTYDEVAIQNVAIEKLNFTENT